MRKNFEWKCFCLEKLKRNEDFMAYQLHNSLGLDFWEILLYNLVLEAKWRGKKGKKKAIKISRVHQ